jgi:hypothetical protein
MAKPDLDVGACNATVASLRFPTQKERLAMIVASKQNQTDPGWISDDPNRPGTGIFIVPNVNGREGPLTPFGLTKVFIGGLTYAECALRGSSAVVFKWVPESVANIDQLRATTCSGDRCVDTCADYGCTCPIGFCA